MRRLVNFVIVCAAVLPASIGNAFAADKIPVVVSIVPQKYFVQQIGKDLVDVQVMVPPGASPHIYEPKAQQMAALSKTRIYFAVGVPFESVWLDKIAATNPEMRVVHTEKGIEKMAMAAHIPIDEAEAHPEGSEHLDEGEQHGEVEHENHHHDHGAHDPHIWLSPPLVKIQARAILTALQEIDPAHRNDYAANYLAFAAQIDQLDADLKNTFAGRTGLQFLVFHPSWGYFAQAYGLEQVPVEIEGKNPKPAQLRALIMRAREKGIRVVFVQPQFSAKSATVVAREIGGRVAFADPLAEDWLVNLQEVATNFEAALK